QETLRSVKSVAGLRSQNRLGSVSTCRRRRSPIMPTPCADVASCLAEQPLFKDLPQADLRRIAAQTASRSLGRGEALFSAGQPCEGLYLVVAGLVRLYAKGASGQEKVIEVISAGGCVSEATMF